jgi:hypothetical protein
MVNAEIHNHNTHQKLNLCVQFCRTNGFRNGVMSMGIKLCNKFANKIRKVQKIRQFKRELRSHLLQHTFHSSDEYMS